MRQIPDTLGRIPRPSLGRGVALLALRLAVLIVLSVGSLIGLAGSNVAGAAAGVTVDSTMAMVRATGNDGIGTLVLREDLFTTFNESVTDTGSSSTGEGTGNSRQSTSVVPSGGTLEFHSDADSDATATCLSSSDCSSFPARGSADQRARAVFTLTEDAPFTFQGELATASNNPAHTPSGNQGDCTHVRAIIRAEDRSDIIVDHEVGSGPSYCPGTSSPGTSLEEQGVLPAGTYSIDMQTFTGVRTFEQGTTLNASSSWNVDLTVGACSQSAAASSLESASSEPFTAAAAEQCVPGGHLAFTRSDDVFDRLMVASSDGTNPSAPLGLAIGDPGVVKQAAWSPDGEHLAFMKGNEIFTMTAGGSDVRQLTDGPGANGHPDWSPDGNKIAFVSSRDGNNELYVMDSLDGSNPKRLTNNSANDIDPAWSPGGQKLVFSSDRRGGQFDIFSMGAAGGGTPVRLTNDPARDLNPAFAPGGLIVFDTLRDGNAEIYTMRATGDDQQNLTENTENIETSPQDFDPAISPDGNFVAFVSDRDGDQEIYAMPILGGAATNLTNNPGEDDREPDLGTSACTFYGTNSDDTILRAGHVCGGPGDDELTGKGAKDVLDGGNGDDKLLGKGGADRLIGGNEPPNLFAVNDLIKGGEGEDDIFAGAGNDTVAGGGGGDLVIGGEGKDDLEGDLGTTSPGADLIRGGPGPDTIGGGAGGDPIHGDEGNDTIDGDAGEDKVRGGADKDIMFACDEQRDEISGGPGTEPGDSQDEATFESGLDVLGSVEVRRQC